MGLSRFSLVLAAAVLVTAAPASLSAEPSAITQRAVASEMDKLQILLRRKAWDWAAAKFKTVEGMIQTYGVSNQIVLDRLAAAKQELTDNSPGPDVEQDRLARFIRHVRRYEKEFPQSPALIRVRTVGGDAATLVEALNRGDLEKSVIVLSTGSHTMAPPGPRPKSRFVAVFAEAGNWPRLLAPSKADFTIERPMFIDGVEIVAGQRGVSSGQVDLSNCYLRAATIPAKDASDPIGLSHQSSRARDCAFENFVSAITPENKATVRNNLFITCLAGVRADDKEAAVERCMFYRCLAGVAGRKITATNSVFSRCRMAAADKTTLDRKDSLELDDPFRDPFKGDFRLRSGLSLPGEMQKSAIGPDWGGDRWEMFAANFGRSVDSGPLGLGELRDNQAIRLLAEARDAAGKKDFESAVIRLADLFSTRYANCPSIRDSGRDITNLGEEVLNGLASGSSTTQPSSGGESPEIAKARHALSDGKIDEAVDLALKACRAQPQSLDAQQTAAEALLAQGRPIKAKPFIRQASLLLEAEAGRVTEAFRDRQKQIVDKAVRVEHFSAAWLQFRTDMAMQYSRLAPKPGPVSGLLALRRANLLDPDNKDYRTRLAVHESLLQAAPPPGEASNRDKADELRAQADKLFKGGKYDEAMAKWSEAYKLAPMPEDLIDQARCNQKLVLPSPASALAVQARQMSSDIAEVRRRTGIHSAAQAILKVVDGAMTNLDQKNIELAEQLEARRKAAEAGGDKDTADQIAAVQGELPGKDSLMAPKKPAGGEQ